MINCLNSLKSSAVSHFLPSTPTYLHCSKAQTPLLKKKKGTNLLSPSKTATWHSKILHSIRFCPCIFYAPQLFAFSQRFRLTDLHRLALLVKWEPQCRQCHLCKVNLCNFWEVWVTCVQQGQIWVILACDVNVGTSVPGEVFYKIVMI